jgi:hypothetical protein
MQDGRRCVSTACAFCAVEELVICGRRVRRRTHYRSIDQVVPSSRVAVHDAVVVGRWPRDGYAHGI